MIAAAVAVIGAFFPAAGVMEWPFLQAQPPGVYLLIGVSVALLLGGCYFFLKACRGHLDPQGETIAEVRMRAIDKMQSTELISRIAQDDSDPEVRQEALQRLTEIVA